MKFIGHFYATVSDPWSLTFGGVGVGLILEGVGWGGGYYRNYRVLQTLMWELLYVFVKKYEDYEAIYMLCTSSLYKLQLVQNWLYKL